MEIRKAALRLLIVSIVVSGVLAIAVLVMPETGRLAAKVLLSALATSGASICGMACGAAWDRGRWKSVALGGLVITGITLTVTLISFWVEPEPIETWMKFVGSSWVFSAAAAHICLLALAPDEPLLDRIRMGTVLAAVLLAAGISLPIWSEDFQNEPYQRGVGVVAVLLLMGSLSLPILARLRTLPDREGDVPGTAPRMCPACSHVQTAPLGTIECEQCGARYRVELESS
jgi:hypothetical protein